MRRRCVDMPDWDVSQVADAHELFMGRSSFYQGITGWTLADNANTAGMFTGADTWLSRAYQTDGSDTMDGPPSAWSFNKCLENERVEPECARPALVAGPEPPETTLHPATSRARLDSTALKAAVDNCLAVDQTGVACCSRR